MDGVANVLDLHRSLASAGAPAAEVERRTVAALKASLVSEGTPTAPAAGCAMCRDTGWVQARTTTRLYPEPITYVRPCTCPLGQVRRHAIECSHADRRPSWLAGLTRI